MTANCTAQLCVYVYHHRQLIFDAGGLDCEPSAGGGSQGGVNIAAGSTQPKETAAIEKPPAAACCTTAVGHADAAGFQDRASDVVGAGAELRVPTPGQDQDADITGAERADDPSQRSRHLSSSSFQHTYDPNSCRDDPAGVPHLFSRRVTHNLESRDDVGGAESPQGAF